MTDNNTTSWLVENITSLDPNALTAFQTECIELQIITLIIVSVIVALK